MLRRTGVVTAGLWDVGSMQIYSLLNAHNLGVVGFVYRRSVSNSAAAIASAFS